MQIAQSNSVLRKDDKVPNNIQCDSFSRQVLPLVTYKNNILFCHVFERTFSWAVIEQNFQ